MIRFFSAGLKPKSKDVIGVELKGFLTRSDRVVISADPVQISSKKRGAVQ
jgi:hypothetical protein